MITEAEIQAQIKKLNPDSKTCHKIAFPSAHEAGLKLKQYNKSKHLKKKLTDYYYCNDCSAWHLTSKDKVKNRKQRRAIQKSNG